MFLKDDKGNVHTAFKHKCAQCGKIFYTRAAGDKWCSKECREEFNRLNRESYVKKLWTDSVRKSQQTIKDIALAASNEGLSYGEYVAKRLK